MSWPAFLPMALSVFRRRRPEALSEQMRAALAEISKNRADGYEVMEYPGAGLIPSAHWVVGQFDRGKP
jgi:hypothetical protein